MNTDPYAALGVAKTASDDEIRKAYRKIARSSHPDLNPDDADAEARFKAASAAYDLLRDPETRARFDRGEIDASGAETHTHQQRRYYRDFADAGDNPYGEAFGGWQRHDASGFDDIDPSDIFAQFFHQRGRAGGGEIRGMDARYALEVPFLDAVKGARTRITLPDGAALEVRIPEGSADGQTIRLRGKGHPAPGGGRPGDALVTLAVTPHPLFRREGDDIVLTLPITIDEAILGGRVETPTIEGPVMLTIPKGANSGQTLRLRNRGVKKRGSRDRGDQRVELTITTPTKIDPDLAEFMEKWRRDHGYDPRKRMKA